MIIEIPDKLEPKERKKFLKVLPVIYALNLFNGNRTQAGNFLSLSVRTIRNIIRDNFDLIENDFAKKREIKKHDGYNEMMKRYPSK